VEVLFKRGCGVVVLACNTASAVAARALQQQWLPQHFPDRRILGIIAPTVEGVTQTPWSVKVPQFPQKFNTDTVAWFGTRVTVESKAYEHEIAKRCPRMHVVAEACPNLVPMIEAGAPKDDMRGVVQGYVQALLAQVEKAPEWAILGCTHYPLIQDLFVEALPPSTRVLDQPKVVADALEDYLERHPGLLESGHGGLACLTSGDPAEVSRVATLMMGKGVRFLAW
jgi:glutamate racemase